MRYGCDAFGRTSGQLREAVSAAAQEIDNVRAHLSQPNA